MRIDPEFKALIPALTDEERSQLELNLVADGCIDPLKVWNDTLVDGHNRYAICQEHGIEFKTVEVELADRDAVKLWIIEHQLGRRNLQPFQRIELGIDRERLFPNQQGKRTDTSITNVIEVVRPTYKAADLAGVSHNTYAKGKVIANKADEETKEQLRRGKVSIDKVYKDIRGKERRRGRVERIQEISQGNEDLDTSERFPVIYADPPWRYEHQKTDNRAVENHYPTMTLDDICDLPVADLATDDAILFMWATSPKLEEACRVVEAWDFEYRTNAVWVKGSIGPGYYFRQQHEMLLVAVRGSMPVPEPSNRPSSFIHAPRGAHSQKPTLVSECIERMYPEFNKIELFSRAPRKGWKSWGNQSSMTSKAN